ncbi:MAG: hypothetical protein HYY16_01430 [Planctomycetes bacterium]|nr:hypothetical protein [Planctomycetota bacterium]
MNIALALRGDLRDPAMLPMVLPIVASSGAFGAAIGSYVGGMQILFAAVKMPLFFLGTLAICMAILAMLAAPRMGWRQAVAVAVRSVFTTTLILGALAPPLFVAGMSFPKPHPRAYLGMALLLTLAVALAGGISVARLRRALPSNRLWLAWIGIYGFVGAQMAWLLKPWIGHTLVADRFIPLDDNLRGNFYDAVWTSMVGILR